MTEPTIIFASPPHAQQTATISADLLYAYVALQRAAEYQLAYHKSGTVGMLSSAVDTINSLKEYHHD